MNEQLVIVSVIPGKVSQGAEKSFDTALSINTTADAHDFSAFSINE